MLASCSIRWFKPMFPRCLIYCYCSSSAVVPFNLCSPAVVIWTQCSGLFSILPAPTHLIRMSVLSSLIAQAWFITCASSSKQVKHTGEWPSRTRNEDESNKPQSIACDFKQCEIIANFQKHLFEVCLLLWVCVFIYLFCAFGGRKCWFFSFKEINVSKISKNWCCFILKNELSFEQKDYTSS